MPCSHCPHCRAHAVQSSLVLPEAPTLHTAKDARLAFYLRFGQAYDAARAQRLRPRQALMTANPWLTASQCAAYLKRARELRLVQSAPRAESRPPQLVLEATPPAPGAGRGRAKVAAWTPEQSAGVWCGDDLDLTLENAKLTGRPVTVAQLQRNHPERLTDAQARAVLDWAVVAGGCTRADDGESVHP